MHVAGLVPRFQATDDRQNSFCSELPCHPTQHPDTRRRSMFWHNPSGQLNEPGPTLGMALFVLREFLKDRRPFFISFGGGHRMVKGDSVHLNNIILLITGDVRCGRVLLGFHCEGSNLALFRCFLLTFLMTTGSIASPNFLAIYSLRKSNYMSVNITYSFIAIILLYYV